MGGGFSGHRTPNHRHHSYVICDAALRARPPSYPVPSGHQGADIPLPLGNISMEEEQSALSDH